MPGALGGDITVALGSLPHHGSDAAQRRFAMIRTSFGLTMAVVGN